MFNIGNKKLNGAWEERGVIGTRIEIEGNIIDIMWRNSTVLKTKFKTVEKDGKLSLILNDKEMRYTKDTPAYATVEEIYFENDSLHFIELFPITGTSTTVLSKTTNSRYGNYEIVDDEILPLLQGKWISNDEYLKLEIKGRTIACNDNKTKIHILKSNGSFVGKYEVVDDDPSKFSLLYFNRVEFDGVNILAYEYVCDAPSVEIVFRKNK